MSCFAFELHFLSVTGLLAITLGDYLLHPKMHFQNLIGLKLQSSVIACFSNLSHTLGISLPLDLHHRLSLAKLFQTLPAIFKVRPYAIVNLSTFPQVVLV